MPPRYVLIGPPGAGKSTIGKILANTLGLSFIDSDKSIVAEAGKSISDLFVLDGEAVFREIERLVVAQELHDADGVLALGGGSILNEQTQQDIQSVRAGGARIIFLDVSISQAAPRIGFNRDRPLLLGNPRAQWLALMQERRPIYEALADLRVDTSESTPEQSVQQIISNFAQAR